MSRVIWTKPAIKDLDRLFSFLKKKNPDAAKKAALQIKETANQIADLPELGKPMTDDTGRREVFTSFGKKGYLLRYMLDEEKTPAIIRVWHTLENR